MLMQENADARTYQAKMARLYRLAQVGARSGFVRGIVPRWVAKRTIEACFCSREGLPLLDAWRATLDGLLSVADERRKGKESV